MHAISIPRQPSLIDRGTMKQVHASLVLLLLMGLTNAQGKDEPSPTGSAGRENWHLNGLGCVHHESEIEDAIAEDPEEAYRLWEVDEVHRHIVREEKHRKKRNDGCEKLYRIPVIFHVLYFEEKYRVPPERFDLQLKCTSLLAPN